MAINTGLHYPIHLDDLPESWCVDYIEQFTLEVESGFACGEHNSEGDGITHLRPMNISRAGHIDLSDCRSVPQDFNQKRLFDGDVLFNNTNSPELIGKTAYISKKYVGLAFSNHMTRLRFHKFVDPIYATLQLHYLWAMKYYLHQCVKHVNQASISTRDMVRTIPFVLPPLNEQKRIVAKIEELFSELDNGIAALKTAREQLKVYRQAVLKHAFEGKLTAQWRAENADKLETPEQLLARIQTEREARYQQQLDEWSLAVKVWEESGKTGKKTGKPREFIKQGEVDEGSNFNFDIPDSWSAMLMGHVFSVHVGSTPSRKESGFWNGDISWVSSGEVAFCEIHQTSERITQDGYENASTEIHPEGTVLLAMIGEGKTRGQAAILRVPAAHNQNTAAIRVSEIGLPSEYIYYFFQYQYEQTRRVGSGNNQKALNKQRVASIQFPLCSKEEQAEIVIRLSEQLSVAENMDNEIIDAISRAETLRQSILKKAFSGQLVPQDPTDEPASELLARIKAEKENSPQSPFSKGGSKAKTVKAGRKGATTHG